MTAVMKRARFEKDTNVHSDIDRLEKPTLHQIVARESFQDIKMLLEKGADVSVSNSEGLTPLHLAFRRGDREIINLVTLADQSCYRNLNPVDDRGFSHFHAACMQNDPKVVKTYLENGVDVNGRVTSVIQHIPTFILLETPKVKRTITLDGAIDISEVNLNVQELPIITLNWFRDFTPLHFAVENKCCDTVDLLVNFGADVNAKNAEGQTPLHLACARFNERILRTLIRSAANVDTRCGKGKTPLHYAVDSNHLGAVEILIGSGVNLSDVKREEMHELFNRLYGDINFRDENGLTLLHKAVRNGQLLQIQILLYSKANVNSIESNEHSTALHLVAKNVSPELVDLFLKNGADTTIRNHNGQTPLHVLAYQKEDEEQGAQERIEVYKRVISSLMNFGCKIDARDSLGSTALHVACASNNLNALCALLENGADINIVDDEGNIAITGCTKGYVLKKLIREIFSDHIMKLNNISFHVSEKTKTCFTEFWWSRHTVKFSKRCANELKLMRKRKIIVDPALKDKNPSFYDVIHKSNCEMMRLIENEVFMEFVESGDLENMFPYYSYLIKLQVNRGIAKRAYIEARNFLSRLGLPEDCSERILENLTDGHIRLLNKAMRRV